MADGGRHKDAGSFARGSEIWMHQFRLLLVAGRNALVSGTVIGLLSAGVYFYLASTDDHRYFMGRQAIAQVRLALEMTKGPMSIQIDHHENRLPVLRVLALSRSQAQPGWRHARNGSVVGGVAALWTVIFVAMYWWWYGREKMTDREIRGASLVSAKALSAIMTARKDVSPYMLAGVPMRANAETLHTLISGAQGTGKSQIFFALMKQIRARGKRAIIYDPTGEFTAAFYREGKDKLCNPFDSRCPNWTPWNEISKDYHFDNIANGLIPEPAGYDPFWALAGRMVFKDTIRVLGQQGKRTNRALYDGIAKSNLDQMYALLKGTAGATYVDPISERTGMSLKMTVQNQLEAFRFLPDSGEHFSIRDWIHEESDSWMFITVRESMRDALKSVLTLWMSAVSLNGL